MVAKYFLKFVALMRSGRSSSHSATFARIASFPRMGPVPENIVYGRFRLNSYKAFSRRDSFYIQSIIISEQKYGNLTSGSEQVVVINGNICQLPPLSIAEKLNRTIQNVG